LIENSSFNEKFFFVVKTIQVLINAAFWYL